MGQASNNHRNASLDNQKQRAAGRQGDRTPAQNAIDDANSPLPMKGKAGGAFGKGKVNRKQGATIPRQA